MDLIFREPPIEQVGENLYRVYCSCQDENLKQETWQRITPKLKMLMVMRHYDNSTLYHFETFEPLDADMIVNHVNYTNADAEREERIAADMESRINHDRF